MDTTRRTTQTRTQFLLSCLALTLLALLAGCDGDSPLESPCDGRCSDGQGTRAGGDSPEVVDTDGDDVHDGEDNCPDVSNPTQSDSDGDGIGDLCGDGDGDGAVDAYDNCPEVSNPTQADLDGDGVGDLCDDDIDGDGLSNDLERAFGLAVDDTDSDDDGILDGTEGVEDIDGDLLVNALDVDSDNDGLLDGLEASISPESLHADTDRSRGHYKVDADLDTATNPYDPDTDGNGMLDGSEDWSLDGAFDPGESDPLDASDDGTLADTDEDGLSDAVEVFIGTDPLDADTDDDGLLDGLEDNWALDHDRDGLIQPLDIDSDNDALADGLERGVRSAHLHTNVTRGGFVVDADPSTRTGTLLWDTDRGGASDGSEDVNADGQVSQDERNPLDPRDDASVSDQDGDGLADALEVNLGSDPFDMDSDDDGLLDGLEPNPAWDLDQDRLVSVLDPDSDNDLIFDGTEFGVVEQHEDTDADQGFFVPDSDPNTWTGVLNPDSDGGGAHDGGEDLNRDGAVDEGETDPLDPTDDFDAPGDTDGDGLPDGIELQLGTGVAVADSDGDSLEDGLEIELGTDPLHQDTDRDGRDDGYEVSLGDNPLEDERLGDGGVEEEPFTPTEGEADDEGTAEPVYGDGSVSRDRQPTPHGGAQVHDANPEPNDRSSHGSSEDLFGCQSVPLRGQTTPQMLLILLFAGAAVAIRRKAH